MHYWAQTPIKGGIGELYKIINKNDEIFKLYNETKIKFEETMQYVLSNKDAK